MALKDRDYMKRWGRDDPYHNQLELGPPGSERIVATGVGERSARPRLGMRWPFQILALLVLAAAGAAFIAPHWSSVSSQIHRLDERLSAHSSLGPTLSVSSKEIRLRWHQGLTTRVNAPTLWWIDTSDGKRVQITVPTGQTPLAALRQALAAHGWRAVYP